MIQKLRCSSMQHVIDRAVAFRFCEHPYHCVLVTPNSVTLYRYGRQPHELGHTIIVIAQTFEESQKEVPIVRYES